MHRVSFQIFITLCVGVFYFNVCVHHVHARCSWISIDYVRPLELEVQVIVSSIWVFIIEVGPLEDYIVAFITEPSLQPTHSLLIFYTTNLNLSSGEPYMVSTEHFCFQIQADLRDECTASDVHLSLRFSNELHVDLKLHKCRYSYN